MIWTAHTIGAMIINNLLCRKLCAAGPISPWKGSYEGLKRKSLYPRGLTTGIE